MKPYEPWDFCKTISCPDLGKNEICRSCCLIFQFHQYLKDNGQILEEGSELAKVVAEAERLREENEKLKTEVSLEDTEKFYQFLQGVVPECLTLVAPPILTAEQAFSVIYYLQEIMHIIPDKYEKCRECGDLFDSCEGGCAAMFCDGCGCQFPDGYDPYETGCDSCPILLDEGLEG